MSLLQPLTREVVSTAGVWTTLAVGPLVSRGIEASAAQSETRIGLRLTVGSASSLIVPADLLPAGAATRPRLPALPLGAGASIQVLSDAPVAWKLAGWELISPRQYSRVAASSGDAWVTVANAPGEVSALLGANVGMGDATVSIRVARAGGEMLLVPGEVVSEGASVRLVPAATLGAGETLQVRSRGAMQWVATGVSAS